MMPKGMGSTDLPQQQFRFFRGLISYAANVHAQLRRAAWFVDRILRGTKIDDVPVELPSNMS